MESTDVVVIGAGVVGIACARALALAGREVLLLESESGFGTGVSSRNSEVIHAGLYYPNGSLKARHCVAGRQLLYDYCSQRGVPFRRCGKLLVATEASQVDQIDKLRANAAGNGAQLVDLVNLTCFSRHKQLAATSKRDPPLRAIVVQQLPAGDAMA